MNNNNASVASEKKVTVKKIAIIGSGFVGKAAGKGFLAKGHDVTFIDINTMLLESLAKDGLPVCNIGSECSNDSDVYMVSVLTPTINDQLDFRFIDSAVASLGQALKDNPKRPLVVIRSTVPPGTTEDRFVPILEKYSGKRMGKDFDVAMNPEFLREVSADEDFAHPWVVVIGSRSYLAAETLEEIYEPFGAPIVHMTIKEAEMMKYVHNIYNASKISFFNEMRDVAKAVGVDADKIFTTVMESAEAAWNKKYGIRDFGPYDGSCLPKDTQAFITWADEVAKKKMPLLHSIIKVNENLKEKQYFEY
jgi:UDPglucose 6-dehydrogenase